MILAVLLWWCIEYPVIVGGHCIIKAGVGVTISIPSTPLFSEFFSIVKNTLAIEYHVFISQVTPVDMDGKIQQVLMRDRKFVYGEINERNFSKYPPPDCNFIKAGCYLIPMPICFIQCGAITTRSTVLKILTSARVRYWMSCVDSYFESFSTIVTVALYTISCYIGPRYDSIQLYFKPNTYVSLCTVQSQSGGFHTFSGLISVPLYFKSLLILLSAGLFKGNVFEGSSSSSRVSPFTGVWFPNTLTTTCIIVKIISMVIEYCMRMYIRETTP